jgi:hypothetical protein
MRLLHFLNKIYRETLIPYEWRNAITTPIFKKGKTEGNPKTTEKLVSLILVSRYTLKFLI